MADTQVIECDSACTITVYHEFVAPILNLTLEQGGLIAGSILLVWAVGFSFRLLVRVIRDTDNKSSYED